MHPGTVDSALSKPFQSNIQPNSIFTPEHSVSQMINVLDNLTSLDTGKCFSYDAKKINFVYEEKLLKIPKKAKSFQKPFSQVGRLFINIDGKKYTLERIKDIAGQDNVNGRKMVART